MKKTIAPVKVYKDSTRREYENFRTTTAPF